MKKLLLTVSPFLIVFGFSLNLFAATETIVLNQTDLLGTEDYVESTPTPKEFSEYLKKVENCRKLFDHIKCLNGIHLIGGATMSGGLGGDVSWLNIGLNFSGGISLFNAIDVEVEGGGLVYPIVYQTFTYGASVTVHPINGFLFEVDTISKLVPIMIQLGKRYRLVLINGEAKVEQQLVLKNMHSTDKMVMEEVYLA